MSTVTARSKTLSSKQRTWLKKMGDALGVATQIDDANQSAPPDELPEVMWKLKKQAFDDADSAVKEMEESQLSKAPLFRKGLTLVQGLVDKKKFAEADKAFSELEPKITAEYEKFQKARGNGVRDLDGKSPDDAEAPGKDCQHATGLDIPNKSDGESAEQGQGGAATPDAAKDPNAASYQKQVLKVGSKGPAVEYLQKLLGEPTKVDGKFGPDTQGAVKKFQTSKGLKPDGIVGEKTWPALVGGGAATPAAASTPTAGTTPTPAKAGAKQAPDAGKPGSSPAAPTGGGFITAPVGKGGKNLPDDVKAIQAALNKYSGAKLLADGKYSAQLQKAIEEFQKKVGQFKPDGLLKPDRGPTRVLSGDAEMPPTPEEPKPIEPPVLGKATLDKGAFVWHSTRGILDTNIKELKKGVRAAYGTEHKDLLKAIDDCMEKMGSVVDKLDTRLADTLDAAWKAKSDQARLPELKKAEGIMKEYLAYVKSEPLIGHMDDNPFGVKTSLMKVITDALRHLSQLLPKQSSEKS